MPQRADRTEEVAARPRRATSPRSTTSARSSTSSPRSATCCPTTACSSRTSPRSASRPTSRSTSAGRGPSSRPARPARSAPRYAQGVGAQAALDAEGRGRKALVVAGDGGFLFTGNELATAVQHDIPLVACVFDDGAFGNVKRIQQQRFGAGAHDRVEPAQPRLRGVRRGASARSASTRRARTSCASGSTRRSARTQPAIVHVVDHARCPTRGRGSSASPSAA